MIGRYIADHWAGRHGPMRAVVVNLIIGRLIWMALLAWMDPRAEFGSWPVIAADATLLIWQAVGAVRSVGRHLRSASDQLAMFGGYGAVLVAALMFASQTLDRMTADVVIDPGPRAARPAWAPEPLYRIGLDGTTLRISGEISYALVQEARLVLAEADATTVEIDSNGGQVFAARTLASLIREHGLNTHVTGACRSACVLAFAGGEVRTLGPDGVLGLHGYANNVRIPYLDVEAEMAQDRSFLQSRGIDAEFLGAAFAVPHDQIWEPDKGRLTAAGVLTR